MPKNCPKSVQIDKKGDFSSKVANINSKYDSFHNKIQFKGLFNINFSGIFNSKDYPITFLWNDLLYSKGFMKFGSVEPSKIMMDF